jgi:UDP-3-O-[3-hydroxymyristoyl] glucosamine N-acyltransferase
VTARQTEPAPAEAPAAAGRGGGGASLTAAAIAERVGGRLVGDGARVVRRVAALDRAAADAISFYASARYAGEFAASACGVVLVSPALADTPGGPATRVVVDKPHEALLAVIPALYAPPPRVPGVHPTAVLGRGVRLGADVVVGPHVVLGDDAVLGDRAWIDAGCSVGARAELGDDSRLHAGVTLYPETVLGRRVVVHAGARLGVDGFGYVFGDRQHRRIPHVGRVVVEDDVEIGANVTVDRGSVGDTVIGAGTKIDNLVHIGHNCRIGRLCLIMAQVGIAGSATIEDGVILAGQAGLGGHITVGKGARVGGQAGVFGDVEPGLTVSGYPARRHKEALRATAATFKLAALLPRLERLLAEREAEAEPAAAEGDA